MYEAPYDEWMKSMSETKTLPVNPAFTEQGLQAYQVDEYGTVYLAATEQEAMEEALRDWGGEKAHYWPAGEDDVTPMNLDENKIAEVDEDENPTGEHRSFREEIQQLLADGVKAPILLCGQDW